MFEVPDAKRVRRSELFSATSSRTGSESELSSDDNVNDEKALHGFIKASSKDGNTLRSRVAGKTEDSNDLSNENDDDQIPTYGFEYDFIEVSKDSNIIASNAEINTLDKQNDDNDEADQDPATSRPREQTFEFHLFKPKPASAQEQAQQTSKTSTSTEAPGKITIRSPTPETARDPEAGGILRPRPHSHYFTALQSSAIREKLQSEYHQTAVSGTEIELSASQTAWPGTHLPWRIIHIRIPATKNKTQTNTKAQSQSFPSQLKQNTQDLLGKANQRSKPKPSKKRRILLRRLLTLRQTQQQATQQASIAAEEAEREKRTRRNREKKVKRKEREKRKKELQVLGGGGDGVDEGEEGKKGDDDDDNDDDDNNTRSEKED